jgi:hypothetical protein
LERTAACEACEGAGCAACHGSGQISQRVHLSPEESRALWADEARRKREASKARLRTEVERLQALVDEPLGDEERAELQELRRALSKARQRARGRARAATRCPTCDVPAGDGAGHGSWDTELACPECGKAARPTRRDLHGWLGRMIEARACAEGRSSCASETTEGVRRALARVAADVGEDLRPSLRSVRVALRCDARFTYEPGERRFDAGFWYWEVRGDR